MANHSVYIIFDIVLGIRIIVTNCFGQSITYMSNNTHVTYYYVMYLYTDCSTRNILRMMVVYNIICNATQVSIMNNDF